MREPALAGWFSPVGLGDSSEKLASVTGGDVRNPLFGSTAAGWLFGVIFGAPIFGLATLVGQSSAGVAAVVYLSPAIIGGIYFARISAERGG